MKHLRKIPCSKDQLSEVRRFVKSALVEVKISGIQCHEIILAIDEICANMIIHSNNCNPCKEIQVSMELRQENQLCFEIMDHGIAFNLGDYREPSLGELIQSKKKGGLGLMLVKKIMDTVEFKCEKGRNICRMVKKL